MIFILYKPYFLSPYTNLHLNLPLTGNFVHFYFLKKKTHSVWFISLFKNGDMGKCLHKSHSPWNTCHTHVIIQICVLICHKNARAHTYTHTHTHTLTWTDKCLSGLVGAKIQLVFNYSSIWCIGYSQESRLNIFYIYLITQPFSAKLFQAHRSNLVKLRCTFTKVTH